MVDTIMRFLLFSLGAGATIAVYSRSKGNNTWNIGLTSIAIVAIILAALYPNLDEITAKLAGMEISAKRKRNKPPESEREKIIKLPLDKQFEMTEEVNNLIENAQKRQDQERSPEDYLILAAQAWRSKQYDKALDYSFAGLNIAPLDQRVKASLLSQIGAVFAELKIESLAFQYYSEAIKTDSKLPTSHYALGNLFLVQKKYAEAEEEYRKAIELDPQNPYARLNYGNLYSTQKKYNEAEIKYKEAIRLYPEFAEAYANLGNLYEDQKRYDEAEKLLIKGVELNPGLANSHNNLGKFYGNQNRYKDAENEFKKAVELDPNSPGAYNNLGALYLHQKNYVEAENALKQAIRLKPDFEMAHNNLALLQREIGK